MSELGPLLDDWYVRVSVNAPFHADDAAFIVVNYSDPAGDGRRFLRLRSSDQSARTAADLAAALVEGYLDSRASGLLRQLRAAESHGVLST